MNLGEKMTLNTNLKNIFNNIQYLILSVFHSQKSGDIDGDVYTVRRQLNI